MTTTYLALLTYVRPVEELDAQMPAHRDWLERGIADGNILAAGRRVPRNGGVILARGEDLETVTAMLAQDPFQLHGLATVEVFPFQASLVAEGLEGLL